MGPRRTFRNSFDIPGDDAGPRDEGITIVWRSFRMGAQVPYVFTLTTTIPASAQEIYDAWLDSLTHSEMTRSEASMSDEVGALCHDIRTPGVIVSERLALRCFDALFPMETRHVFEHGNLKRHREVSARSTDGTEARQEDLAGRSQN
jgi:hypothetical protein